MSFRAEIKRLRTRSPYETLWAHLRWYFDFIQWRRAAFTEKNSPIGTPDTTVIILSYLRPHNIETLVRVALAMPSVRRVIVSNNNSRIRMRDWLDIRDARLSVMDQLVDRPCHFRFELARRCGPGRYLCIDDDIFLKPSQLEMVLAAQRADPARPYGMFGQIKDTWTGQMQQGIRRCNCNVDFLNRVYAFTYEHAVEFYRLADALGITPVSRAWKLSNWDDILLGFSADRQPKVIDSGPYLDCPTEQAEAVAVWKRKGFFDYRIHFFAKIAQLKSPAF